MTSTGEFVMQQIRVCKSFKFAKSGTTKDASFTGPVVLMQEGLFLVAKKVTTNSHHVAGAVFGLLGVLIASLFDSLDKTTFPYPVVTESELPDALRDVESFGRLKEKHKIVILQREQILGYTSSFIKGFRLVCTGEEIRLMGSKKKLITSFVEFGYAEYKPEEKEL